MSYEECDIICLLIVIIVEIEEEKDFWWNRKGIEVNRIDNFCKVIGYLVLIVDMLWLR